MKINEPKLKAEIEEIIANGAAYAEEVDITTKKIMDAIKPLLILVNEFKP